MKHKASVLLCEMDNGTVNIYVNGVQVFVDNKPTHTPIERIANAYLTNEHVMGVLCNASQQIQKHIDSQ